MSNYMIFNNSLILNHIFGFLSMSDWINFYKAGLSQNYSVGKTLLRKKCNEHVIYADETLRKIGFMICHEKPELRFVKVGGELSNTLHQLSSLNNQMSRSNFATN